MVRLALPALGVHLEGWSVGGIETWLRIPEWSLAFDVGRVALPSVRCRHLALTHGHLDHAGGLAGWLGLRRMFGMPPAQLYVPHGLAAPLIAIVSAWERLQGVTFDYVLHPAVAGQQFTLGSGRWLQSFAVDHGVEALGWAVVEERSRLLPSLHGLSGAEISARRARGEEVAQRERRVLLAVSGDTRATAATHAAELRSAVVVLHEVTLLSEEHPPERAWAGHHTHLSDVVDSEIAAEAALFVPYHISQRYDADTARRLLVAALGERFGARMVPLLPPALAAPTDDAAR